MRTRAKTRTGLLLLCLLTALLLSACSSENTAQRRTLPDAQTASSYETLRWPNNELSAWLPQPESVRGEVAWNDANGLGIYVADVSAEAFRAYAEDCWRLGFSVNYHLDDNGFEAKNVYGYQLYLNYEEGAVMLIRLEAPQELANPSPSEPATASDGMANKAASPDEATECELPPKTPDSTTGTYVLNKNTKKFHLPTCASVGDIKENNREDFCGSRDELIAQGYEPCKRCNP